MWVCQCTYLRLPRTTVSETPRSWAYTSNQLCNNLSTLVPWANPVFSSICLFEYFQVTRTIKFPFSCRMQTLQNNWLEMSLHPCNMESPRKSRCFPHAAQQRPWPSCGVPDVCTGSRGRRCLVLDSVYSYLLCQFYFTTNAELGIHVT